MLRLYPYYYSPYLSFVPIPKLLPGMKQIIFLGALLLTTHCALGQQRWSTSILFGTTVLQGDLSGSRVGDFDKMGIAAGANLRYQLNPGFALRLQGIAGDFVGDDLGKGSGSRGFAFRTPFTEGSASLEWFLLQTEEKAHRWSPFISIGAGLLFFEPRADFDGKYPDQPIPGAMEDLSADKGSPQWVIPGSLGIDYRVNSHWQFRAEASLRASFSDYLDGISQAANSEYSDWFLTNTLSVRYTWGQEDLDGDGLNNAEDRCPEQFGPRNLQGCPDTDGDGVADPDDACPDQIGYLDGCPDSDTDGIPDFLDQCPYRPGPPQQSGCPNTDSDADGIPDEEDKCPDRAGPPSRSGCPPEDIDHDGITDEHDQCPRVPGTREHFGCPMLEAPEQYVIETLFFSSGDTTLSNVQQQLLRSVASQLMSEPNQLLLLQGVANSSEGLTIARSRTEQVYNYLLSWGVRKRRINYGVYIVNQESESETAARRVSMRFIKE